MPVVFRQNGFRFHFYSNEGNESPHIHVKKGEGDGKIWLVPGIEVEYFFDFSPAEEKQIRKIVEDNYNHFINQWYEHFK